MARPMPRLLAITVEVARELMTLPQSSRANPCSSTIVRH